ncbi:patatin-like phospholipase family protein [Enhygromyxa salina]|uniref:NTE family protein RssA n=1 Tax=Enhygromyxa salina TaxID=215803 RepID=A0A2S9YWY3_9BACT|nr:patatin-like phospholipase family protein [Enhygromyxa salina]PRQ09606.1 NTE family protein RssA [Enhygromyxa salina]
MIRSHADWLAAEPFTLVLSAGFFGFYAHVGLVCALEQVGLRPRRVVGSSAGAICGGLWASGIPGRDLVELLTDLQRSDFWDPSWQDLRSPTADRDPGTRLGLLRGRKLDGLLANALANAGQGVERIEQCEIPFAAITHELRSRRTHVLERGQLRPAIRASAALPIMFGPVRIDGRLHADGGISDRPGFSALGPDERALYHHLPHRAVFSSGQDRLVAWLGGGKRDDAAERRHTPSRKVIAIDDLPRVHPGALDRGLEAMTHAQAVTLRWLDQPDAN